MHQSYKGFFSLLYYYNFFALHTTHHMLTELKQESGVNIFLNVLINCFSICGNCKYVSNNRGPIQGYKMQAYFDAFHSLRSGKMMI